MNNSNIHLRIAVVFDDHKLFADSFSVWLEKTDLFYAVYTFTDKKDLLDFFFEKKQKNIYLFADYQLGPGNSLDVLNDIKKVSPSVFIIFLTSITNPIFINKAFTLRPRGFLSKTPGMDEVLECLKKVDRNESYISPFITALLGDNNNPGDLITFSSRELEILDFFAKGNSVIKTARELNLSKHTVISHRRKMMAKANCNTIIELLSYARSLNIID